MIEGQKDLISVVVAGGSPLWRVGLSTAIQQDGRLQCVAQAADRRAGVRRARLHAADVLVLLTDEPLTDLPSRRDRFWLRDRRTRLLLLRYRADQPDMAAVLQGGLLGYGIVSTLTPGELADGIVALSQDRTWLCAQTRQLLDATASLERVAVG